MRIARESMYLYVIPIPQALVFIITITASMIIAIAKPNMESASVNASKVTLLIFYVELLSLAQSVYVLVDHIRPFQQGKLLHCRSVYKYGS